MTKPKVEDDSILLQQLGLFAENARKAIAAKTVIIIAEVRDQAADIDDKEVFANMLVYSHESEADKPVEEVGIKADIITSLVRGTSNVITQTTHGGLEVQIVNTKTGLDIGKPNSFGGQFVQCHKETGAIKKHKFGGDEDAN